MVNENEQGYEIIKEVLIDNKKVIVHIRYPLVRRRERVTRNLYQLVLKSKLEKRNKRETIKPRLNSTYHEDCQTKSHYCPTNKRYYIHQLGYLDESESASLLTAQFMIIGRINKSDIESQVNYIKLLVDMYLIYKKICLTNENEFDLVDYEKLQLKEKEMLAGLVKNFLLIKDEANFFKTMLKSAKQFLSKNGNKYKNKPDNLISNNILAILDELEGRKINKEINLGLNKDFEQRKKTYKNIEKYANVDFSANSNNYLINFLIYHLHVNTLYLFDDNIISNAFEHYRNGNQRVKRMIIYFLQSVVPLHTKKTLQRICSAFMKLNNNGLFTIFELAHVFVEYDKASKKGSDYKNKDDEQMIGYLKMKEKMLFDFFKIIAE